MALFLGGVLLMFGSGLALGIAPLFASSAAKALPPYPRYLASLCLVIALSLGSLVYWRSADFQQWFNYQQSLTAQTQLLQQFGPTNEIIKKLEAELRHRPNSAQGWYLLGKLALATQDYAKAKAALTQAYALEPNNPNILIGYAQILFLLKENTALLENLLNKVLKLEPDNTSALNLLALSAYQQQQKTKAITLWQRLLTNSTLTPEERSNFATAIAEAEKN